MAVASISRDFDPHTVAVFLCRSLPQRTNQWLDRDTLPARIMSTPGHFRSLAVCLRCFDRVDHLQISRVVGGRMDRAEAAQTCSSRISRA